MSYPSCNAILDAATLYLPLQDTGATTSLDGGGTLVGGNTAADLTTTGPGAGYSAALALDGTNDYMTFTSNNFGPATAFSTWCWVKTSSTAAQTCFGNSSSANTAAPGINLAGTDLMTRADTGAQRSSSFSTIDNGAWHFLTCAITGDATRVGSIYADGSLLSSGNFSASGGAFNVDRFGARSDTNNRLNGSVAGIGLVSGVVLDADDHDELRLGQEPNYTSGATLSDAGAWNVGTWDSYSNGSLTYSVAAAEADGTPVDTGSGATGTLDLSSAVGELVYLYVRASNNGGYDVGDFATRTGDYGSADDGYYEVASVTAAGGGPSPTGRRRIIRQLIGA
jgi:hypothetical protein